MPRWVLKSGDEWKSVGTKLDEYGGYEKIYNLKSINKVLVGAAVCGLALSCRKNTFFWQRPDLFTLTIAFCNPINGSKYMLAETQPFWIILNKGSVFLVPDDHQNFTHWRQCMFWIFLASVPELSLKSLIVLLTPEFRSGYNFLQQSLLFATVGHLPAHTVTKTLKQMLGNFSREHL